MENASTGRPAICQALILTASPRVLLNENCSEHGIFLNLHCSIQSLRQSCCFLNFLIQTKFNLFNILKIIYISIANSECS